MRFLSRLVTLCCLAHVAFQIPSIAAGVQQEPLDTLLQNIEGLPDGIEKLQKIQVAGQHFLRKNHEKYCHYCEEGLRIVRKLELDSFKLIFITELAQGLIRTNEASEAHTLLEEGLKLDQTNSINLSSILK